MNKKILVSSLRNTFFAVVYIFIVSQIMQHWESWFGKEDNNFTPFALLLLFSLSAAIVGYLIVGQAIFLFLDGQKKESRLSILYSIGCLGIFTLIGLIVLAIIK